MTYNSFNLAPDSLHYAGYEWGLDALVSALAKDLILGRYAPERAEIVRAAKSKGLSRPLCFLAPRDALVYRAITWLVRDQLMTDAQAWVGFTHSDKGTAAALTPSDTYDSMDWFRFWLARQGRILQMIEDSNVEYLVESDIANFYPSIRLDAIREHLHSHTSLDKEVVRLCVQIIDAVMPRTDYSEVSLMGLPQEQVGSSRDIAHSLLIHVDQEFLSEGTQGRYTRFMDDLLIGVRSPGEGESCISRLQRSLETLGLYPNSAKTAVTQVSEYVRDAMVSVNADIDRVTFEIDNSSKGSLRIPVVSPALDADIGRISAEHRQLAVRPKRWDRVARRIYTLHRRVGTRIWWDHWRDDIDSDPGAAGPILEYLRAWPLEASTIEELARLSVTYGDLYSDLSILAAETVLSAPIDADPDLYAHAFTVASRESARIGTLSGRRPERERQTAAWLLAAWKFGNEMQRRQLLGGIPTRADALSPVRVQALPLLAALGDSISPWTSAKPGMAWEDALAAEYLRSLLDGEPRAVGVALNLLEPEARLAPLRYLILPRAVPLIDIVGRSAPRNLADVAPRIRAKLQKNPDRLRDRRTEEIVSRWCP